MRPVLLAAVLLSLMPLASAQRPVPPPVPADFATAWPVQGDDGGEGLLHFALTPEIYAQLARSDLADIAAFNAADEAVPLGPVALVLERASHTRPPTPVTVPMFVVPRATRDGVERPTLLIERDADGRLRRLDAELAPPATDDAAQDILLDLSALDAPVVALDLAIAADAGRVNARVDVEGSRDLSSWRGLVRDQAVVSLNENGVRLERLRLEFTATQLPYLRLRRIDGNRPLPLASVQAQRARRTAVPEPARASFTLAGTVGGPMAGAWDYEGSGPFPIERAVVELAERNAIARVVIESRDDPGLPWRERARGTAFRIGADDGIGAAPFDIAPVRDRHWRVRTDPAQSRAPTLSLAYRPDQFVLLAQGAPPYRLAVGSRRAVRPDYPLRAVLAEVQSRRGDGWLPPAATLGAPVVLSGEAALTPRPTPSEPASVGTWILWGVLVAGAGLVVGMVLHLLRNGGQASGE